MCIFIERGEGFTGLGNIKDIKEIKYLVKYMSRGIDGFGIRKKIKGLLF